MLTLLSSPIWQTIGAFLAIGTAVSLLLLHNSKKSTKYKVLIGFLLILPLIISTSQQQQQIHAATPSTSNHGIGITPGDGFEDPFQNMSSSQQQAVVNQMKSDGVQWLRLDYYNDNASYDYQFIKDAEAAGINVDALLEDFSATPAEFSSFGTQAVNALEPLGVHTYEILDEVNTYPSTITAAQYVPMLKAAYTAIKSADPSSTVLVSGLGIGPGNQEPYTYLQAMYTAGAKGYFDAVNMHPYSFPDMPAESPCSTSNAFCYDLPAMHAVMQQNGDGDKKIWLTEFGCPTGTDAGIPASCTDATLAQQITQAFNQANAWEWTGPFFLFSWQDNTANGDFGLYDANGSPKTAALSAFKQAASLPSVATAPTPTATQAPTTMVTNPTNTPLATTLATAIFAFMTPCAHGVSQCSD